MAITMAIGQLVSTNYGHNYGPRTTCVGSLDHYLYTEKYRTEQFNYRATLDASYKRGLPGHSIFVRGQERSFSFHIVLSPLECSMDFVVTPSCLVVGSLWLISWQPTPAKCKVILAGPLLFYMVIQPLLINNTCLFKPLMRRLLSLGLGARARARG